MAIENIRLKISIITAVYNNCNTIAAALDSVLAQKDALFDLVVIDGGSTDGTLEVLGLYSDRIDVLVSESDLGIYDALNKGIQRTSGDVVGFLHADDLFADTAVLSRITAAFGEPAVVAVYGDLLYVRKDNPEQVVRYWRAGDFSRKRLIWGWMPPHPTFYVRRSIYERLGTFDTSYRIAADYDCMLRFLSRCDDRVTYIPEVLVKMRIGGTSNRSFRNIILKSREDYRALRNNGIGGMASLLIKNFRKLPQFFTRPGGD